MNQAKSVQVRVHCLPDSVPGQRELAASTCVVIDVLRATTTMIAALAAGADAVIPCLTIDDARSAARALSAGRAVLGGERGGLPIDGFVLGNSPAEYTRERVAGKTVVLTTTNGTKALLECRGAAEILVAGFANLSAVVRALESRQQIDLVCAGTDGQITREDVLVAGALVAQLTATPGFLPHQPEAPAREHHATPALHLDDEAQMARDAWLALRTSTAPADFQAALIAALRSSLGGQNLLQIGLAADVEWAATIDRFAVVPRYDAASGRIVSTSPGP